MTSTWTRAGGPAGEADTTAPRLGGYMTAKPGTCICPPVQWLPPLSTSGAGVGCVPGPTLECPVHGPAMRREERAQAKRRRERREQFDREIIALKAAQRILWRKHHEIAKVLHEIEMKHGLYDD